MILFLARKRPEVRLLGALVGLGVVMGLGGAWLARSIGETLSEIQPDVRSGMDADESLLNFGERAWLFNLVASGLLWLQTLGNRWNLFERSLPVEPFQVARAQLVAVLAVTLLPALAGSVLFALGRPAGAGGVFGWTCLAGLGGLGLFATSLLAWQRPGVRLPVRGVAQGALLLLGSILAASFVSARFAGLLFGVLAVCAVAQAWVRAGRPVVARPLREWNPGQLRQRLVPAVTLAALGFYTWLFLVKADLFFVLLVFFLMVFMRFHLAPIRKLGYLPLARRGRAAQAVLLPLFAVLLGGSVRLLAPSAGRIEWGHQEPQLKLTYDGQAGLELRPSNMLWSLHFGRAVPLVTRPDGSTFPAKLMPVLPGLFLRNPYELGSGASEDFVVARAAALARDLYGPGVSPEAIREGLVQRGASHLEPKSSGRFTEAFGDLPRVDFRRRALGSLALILVFWALSVWIVFGVRQWPLLPRDSFLLRLGEKGLAGIGARAARIQVLALCLMVPVSLLFLFHDGFELLGSVLFYQAGSWIAHPLGALVLALFLAAVTAWAIRSAERMDAVRLPFELESAARRV